jgi:hypothetical protein
MWVDYVHLFDDGIRPKLGIDHLIEKVREMGFCHEVRYPMVHGPASFFAAERAMINQLDDNEIHNFDRWTSYLDITGRNHFICLFKSEMDAVMAKLILL